MAGKQFLLKGRIPVTVLKRRGNRNLRLTISPRGQVRVSIPAWAPYKTGLEFAASRYDWIVSQQKPPTILADGQPVGKAHHLSLVAGGTKISTRVTGSIVLVQYPPQLTSDSQEVQTAAYEASVRALRRQAQKLLPQRLQALADRYGFEYAKVSIKRMRSRWGSCDSRRNIALNLFLMQLPWELIDYVLIHELVHTVVLKHGPEFWLAMEAVMPDAKMRRKSLHAFHPVLDA